MEKFILEFLRLAEPVSSVAKHATFSYLVIRHEGRLVLIQGRLMLNVIPHDLVQSFQSGDVFAGQLLLAEIGKTPEDLLRELVSGVLKLPIGEVYFDKYEGGGYSCHLDENQPGTQQGRNVVLTISGRHRDTLFDVNAVDWELRAAVTPYQNLNELLAQYRMAPGSGPSWVEASIAAAAEVDFSLRVNGTKATIGVVTSRDLDPQSVFLGYRVLSNNSVTARSQITGDNLDWGEDGNLIRGHTEIDVPNAAIVHCFAGYAGRAQHHGFIVDPDNHQNARRSTYELFDKNLDNLKEIISRQPGRGARSDDFEAAISWLLWMLGFSPAMLGATPLLKEAPDIIATTPNGHYAVVECTMGLLKADSKLPKVVSRANQVRDQLEKSGSAYLTVLPVMVTSLPKSDIEAELPQAAAHGVYVVTREGIEAALASSWVLPDPERFFSEALEAVAAASSSLSS
ncbi:UNVERIFIED_ORG: hypothetical protein GGD51_001442 [Rhizobium esperanzae]|uniref:hypothetical protein n=1 Tax=Rhizobium phaseoli TaxID=396 RepID=UPI000D67C988|nr:hypothetical protein [Rhizobium phaseoli]PWI53796.1 hypothetical protein B5K03_15670 [Rhizobium phaseoli]